jgi:WD40 repeat protein
VVRTACDTDTNIRAAIINKDRDNATRHRDNLDIHDVKWSHGQYSSTIATAATNGKVVIYDLNRPGVEVARLHEHHRQVHRVAFNPHHGALLLSGSQDATVRLWDLRDMRSDVMTLRSHNRYMGQSDGVRDIRWSPTDGLEFAFGTDGGVVLDWDSRYTKSAKLKINAHHGPCTAVDWHPDGKHIASGGQDNNLMVWDVSSEQRRQKPSWTLRTPYPIANARWRPPCFSGDDQGRGSWQCTQIMTSYERNFPTLNLWDFRRPHMPFREMWPSETTAPTDMLWRSADLLWCVGRTGVFKQIDVKFTAKTIDRRPLTAFAISHTGEMMIFSQKRIRPRGSGFDAPQIFTPRRASQTMLQESPLARSSADDSIDDSFLSSSHQKHHERTLSNRSTKSIGGTPPSLQEVGIAKLSDTLKDNKHAYQPRQVAARGFLPGHPNQQHFCYLAQKYKITALPDDPTVDDFLAVDRVFEQNAKYAEKTSNNRLAQTWRLFGTVLQKELIQRADHNKKRRLGLVKAELDATLVLPKVFESNRERYEKKRLSVRQKSEGTGVKTTNTLKVEESSSNVPTPIARPIQSSSYEFADKRIPNLEQDEQLSLPPAVMTRVAAEGSLSNAGIVAPERSDNLRPMFDGPRWYSSASDLNERKAMMSNYRVPPKMPLDFEVPKAQNSSAINIPPPLDRHNSDESFAMFSASSDSKGGVSMPASYTSQRSRKQSMGSIPEHRMSRYPGTFSADSDNAPSSTPAVTESSQSSSSKVCFCPGSPPL